ncbi:MAG: hypothetical protein PHC64_11055 [Candidatus Gastranaerophilales bacterium]|nr:hypothetical protein [Candidatus Gastranaerophilales bacterium]
MTDVNSIPQSAVSSNSADTTVNVQKTKDEELTNTSLQRYLSTATADNADAKTIFNKLSIDMGSDGKEITKEQLDSYIEDAEEGKINLSDEELDALTDLQENWKTISHDSDSITYANVAATGFKDTLLSVVPEVEEKPDLSSLVEDTTAKVYSYIMESALSSSTNEDASSGLSSLLKTLLSGNTDENDESNANLIAELTNLLADYNANSTVDLEA